MYTVSSQHLSPDLATAGAQYEPLSHGELSSTELIALLNRFRAATGADLAQAELAVTSTGGACTIRNLGGKLVVRSTRDGHARDLYFSPEDIVDHLDRSTTWTPFEPAVIKGTAPRAEPAVAGPGHGGTLLAALAFAVGVGVLFYAVHAATLSDPVDPAPAYQALPDPVADQQARLRNAVGRFATGNTPGDRVISIGEDKTVTFYEVGPSGPSDAIADTFRLARHDTQACLATTANGPIDLISPDTLVYCHDMYVRVR